MQSTFVAVDEGLTEENRITALADVFDALGSRRSYKEPWSESQVADAIREGRGTHFEPALVDLLLNNLATFNALRLQYPDDTPDEAAHGA